MLIDYKEVLRRYIRHVADCEGINFIEKTIRDVDATYENEQISVRFSDDEISELKNLASSLQS